MDVKGAFRFCYRRICAVAISGMYRAAGGAAPEMASHRLHSSKRFNAVEV
jgi:hypothetical protein